MRNFEMCTYLGCLEREHQYLQQRIQQQSATAAGSSWSTGQSHQDMDIDEDQRSKAPRAGGVESSNEMSVQTSSTKPNQMNKSAETCSTCHVCWRLQEITQGCEECGGFALTRPCLICNGICSAIWDREVDMSNEMKTSFWDGTCLLPKADQEAYMIRNLVSNDMDTLVDAMSDLGRTS